MKTIKKFLEKNALLKILISLILGAIFLVTFALTGKNIFLWLEIIPGLYLVPLFLSMFVYAWIIYPISKLIKKDES